MYVPAHYRFDELAALQATIERYDFGILLSPGSGDDPLPQVSHVPFFLDRTAGPNGTLYAHIAVANPHAKLLAEGAPALAVFSGPHAYISPRWYRNPQRDVPTWNYVAVHARGHARLVTDAAGIDAIIARLTEIAEGEDAEAWSIAQLDRVVHERMRPGIVGIELPIERLTGKAKLSQNRDAAERDGVIVALEAQPDHGSRELAAVMRAIGR